MPRIRTLKPEHKAHRKIGPMDHFTYRLWVGLITEADDSGRFVADARQLRALIFPFHPVQLKQVEAGLGRLERSGLIRVYTVNGTGYGDFPSWLDHQKINKPHPSQLPSFDDSRKPPGTFPEASRNVPGMLPEASRNVPGMLPEASRNVPGGSDPIRSDPIRSDPIKDQGSRISERRRRGGSEGRGRGLSPPSGSEGSPERHRRCQVCGHEYLGGPVCPATAQHHPPLTGRRSAAQQEGTPTHVDKV